MKFKDKTRGGYPVRILATDLPGECPIAAWVKDGAEGIITRCYPSGESRRYATISCPYDLIPDIPEPRKAVRWLRGSEPEKLGWDSPEDAMRYCTEDGAMAVKATLEWTPEE